MLSFKNHIQLNEKVLVGLDLDMTLGHGDARVQLNHPTENRLMSNEEGLKEIGHQNLDKTLYQDRINNPTKPFRFTDKEFNENVGRFPNFHKEKRWNFDEHIDALGMKKFKFFPKAIRGLAKLSKMNPAFMKKVIMTARADLTSSDPNQSPQDVLSYVFKSKTGVDIMPQSDKQYAHIIRTGNPEYDISPGVKGTPEQRKFVALDKMIETAKSKKPFKRLIFADDNIKMKGVIEDLSKKHNIPATFYHATPHPTNKSDVQYTPYRFGERK